MPGVLNAKRAVNLGGTNKIIQGQAIDTVCAEFYAACIICNGHFGMMVLLVCNHGDDIDECHGIVIVPELESAADGPAVFGQLPFR